MPKRSNKMDVDETNCSVKMSEDNSGASDAGICSDTSISDKNACIAGGNQWVSDLDTLISKKLWYQQAHLKRI